MSPESQAALARLCARIESVPVQAWDRYTDLHYSGAAAWRQDEALREAYRATAWARDEIERVTGQFERGESWAEA